MLQMTIIIIKTRFNSFRSSHCYSSIRRRCKSHSIVQYSSSFFPVVNDSFVPTLMNCSIHQQNKRYQSYINLEPNSFLERNKTTEFVFFYARPSTTKYTSTSRFGGIGSATCTNIRCFSTSTTEAQIGTTTSTVTRTTIDTNTIAASAASDEIIIELRKKKTTVDKLRFLLEQLESIRSSNYDTESLKVFWKKLHDVLFPMLNDKKNIDTWDSLESAWSIVIDYFIPQYFQFIHGLQTHRLRVPRDSLQKALVLRLEFYKKRDVVARRRQMEKEGKDPNQSSLYDNNKLWQLLQSWEGLPNCGCFTLFLTSSLHDRNCRIQPNEVIEYMSKTRIAYQHPTVFSYTIALSIWNRNSFDYDSTMILQNTLALWKHMETSGNVLPDHHSLNVFLQILSKCEDHQMVQNVFHKYYTVCSKSFRCCEYLLKSYEFVKTTNPKKDVHSLIDDLLQSYIDNLKRRDSSNGVSKNELEKNKPNQDFWDKTFRSYQQYEMKQREYELLYDKQRQAIAQIGTTTSTLSRTAIDTTTIAASAAPEEIISELRKIKTTVDKLRFLLEQLESIRSSNYDTESLKVFWKELHDVMLPMLNDKKNIDTWDSLELAWSIVVDHIIPQYFQFIHHHRTYRLPTNPLYARGNLPRISTVRDLLEKALELRLEFYKKRDVVARRRQMGKKGKDRSLYDNNKLWQLLQSWESLPNRSCLNLLLTSSLCDLDCRIQPNEVIEYMSKWMLTHQHPDCFSYTIALSIWNRNSFDYDSTMILQNTLALWKHMETSGNVLPDHYSLNVFLQILSNCEDHQMVQNVFHKYYTVCSKSFSCCEYLLKSYEFVKTTNPKKDVHSLIDDLLQSYIDNLKRRDSSNGVSKHELEKNIPRQRFWDETIRSYQQYEMKQREYELLYDKQRQILELEFEL